MRAPTFVSGPSGEFVVGHAEIRVQGPSGRRYASPDMIIHYVQEHGYQPPQDFIDGVMLGFERTVIHASTIDSDLDERPTEQ